MLKVISLIFVILLPVTVMSEKADSLLDNNTAFYEGAKQNYIIPSPDDFIMVIDEAAADGYSFAFIPDSNSYDSAGMIIGINIFKIKSKKKKKFSLDQLITDDTTSYRKHYGKSLSISEVIPIVTETTDSIQTFYLNDSTRFIPNVMLGYYNGRQEVLIFELSVSSTFPRFKAEVIFIKCLEQMKILQKGTIGIG